MSDTRKPLPGLTNKTEAQLRDIYAEFLGADVPAELDTVAKLTQAIKDGYAAQHPAEADADAAQARKQAEADAAELAELRAYKAGQGLLAEKQADAARPVAPVQPEGTALYVNAQGREKYLTAQTVAQLGNDMGGYEIKPEKPAALAKS